MCEIVETGATVEPFGSYVSNLFTKWGDLDISIELQNGSYISSPGKKHKQSLLADVLRALRKKGNLLHVTSLFLRMCFMHALLCKKDKSCYYFLLVILFDFAALHLLLLYEVKCYPRLWMAELKFLRGYFCKF